MEDEGINGEDEGCIVGSGGFKQMPNVNSILVISVDNELLMGIGGSGSHCTCNCDHFPIKNGGGTAAGNMALVSKPELWIPEGHMA